MEIPVTFDYLDNRLIKKSYPEGRFLKIFYDKKGKVSFLAAPDTNGKLFATHTFEYKKGRTIVQDAHGNKTCYNFNPDTKRLNSIYRPDLSFETFSWTEKGDLKGRVFGKGRKIYFMHAFKYDQFGNITEDRLFDNLTRTSKESYVQYKRFSQDGKNLLLEEKDSRKKVYYSYYPSNLMQSRLIGSDQKILKREFFEYDENGVLVKELSDDGSSFNQDDLEDVTERHLKIIHNTEQFPIGLPEIIEEYTYDKESNTCPLLKKTVNAYSHQGKLLSQKVYGSDESLAYTLSWEYNSLGLKTSETNALLETTTFAYDSNGNKIEEKGPLTHKKFTYDFLNRLVKETEISEDHHLEVSYCYNKLNQKTAVIDIFGNKTKYTYDTSGKVASISYPEMDGPRIEKFKYDALGNVISFTNILGEKTVKNYNIRGQATAIFYPDGSIERKEYTLDGLLAKEIHKNGTYTVYTHNSFGKVLQKELYNQNGELLKKWSFVYKLDKLLSETDECGETTHYFYDHRGFCIAKTAHNHTTRYEYDTLGRKVKTIEEGYYSEVQKLDLLDRVIEEQILDPAGKLLKKEQYLYNALGKKTHHIVFTDAGVAATITCYNGKGEPELISDPLGNTTRFFYNYHKIYEGKNVFEVKKVDALGQKTIQLQYLGKTLLQETLNPLGQTIQLQKYIYNANLELLSSEITVFEGANPVRRVVNGWEYDSMGRVTKIVEAKDTPQQKETCYFYTIDGEKEKILKPNGVILSYKYDDLNRMVSLLSSDNTIHYSYSYDGGGNLIEIEDHIQENKTVRSYDSAHRLLSETLANGKTLSYTYDGLGQIKSITLPDGSDIQYEHGYYLNTVKRSNYNHSYNYDLAGNPIQEKLINGATLEYTYDLLQRPLSTKTEARQETHRYNALGFPIEAAIHDSLGDIVYEYTYDSLYQLTSDSLHCYTNDSLCNRTSKNKERYQLNALNQLTEEPRAKYLYDANGNLIQKNETHYRYDALDRLTSVTEGETSTSYIYDALHRRLSKTQNHQTTLFLYQGDNEIGSMADNVIKELRVLGLSRGAEVGGAIAIELNGVVYTPLHNSLGSIAMLLGPENACYRYSSFGETTAEDPISNPWRFSSKRFDPETGFYYFGRRYYAPDIGRWTTADPIGFDDGPNLYAYVHNQPLSYIDPDGQWAQLVLDLAISTAIFYAAPIAITYLGASSALAPVLAVITGLNQGLNDVPCPITFSDPLSAGLQKGTAIAATIYSNSPVGVKGIKNLTTKALTNTFAKAGKQKLVATGEQILADRLTKGLTRKVSTLTSSCLEMSTNKTASRAQSMLGKFKVGEYTYTKNAGSHFLEVIKKGSNKGQLRRPYMRSPLTVNEILSSGIGSKDTTFIGGFNWKTAGKFNNSNGIWELGLNPDTKTIYHFCFKP